MQSVEKDSPIRKKERDQGRKELMNTLSSGINPLLKQLQTDDNALQMPELALRCAQFFHSISKYCVGFYKNYKLQQQTKKIKLIKKQEKDKTDKASRGRAVRRENRHAQQHPESANLQPPKKPLTAYIIYFQDKKHNFVQRYPSLNLSELTKLIAKEWKELSESEKQVYLVRASEDRKRYEEQMAQFKRLYGKNYDSSIAESFEEKDDRPVDEAELQAIINAQDNHILIDQPVQQNNYKNSQQNRREDPELSQGEGEGEEEMEGDQQDGQQVEQNGVMQEQISSQEGVEQNENDQDVNGEQISSQESSQGKNANDQRSSSK